MLGLSNAQSQPPAHHPNHLGNQPTCGLSSPVALWIHARRTQVDWICAARHQGYRGVGAFRPVRELWLLCVAGVVVVSLVVVLLYSNSRNLVSLFMLLE